MVCRRSAKLVPSVVVLEPLAKVTIGKVYILVKELNRFFLKPEIWSEALKYRIQTPLKVDWVKQVVKLPAWAIKATETELAALILEVGLIILTREGDLLRCVGALIIEEYIVNIYCFWYSLYLCGIVAVVK